MKSLVKRDLKKPQVESRGLLEELPSANDSNNPTAEEVFPEDLTADDDVESVSLSIDSDNNTLTGTQIDSNVTTPTKSAYDQTSYAAQAVQAVEHKKDGSDKAIVSTSVFAELDKGIFVSVVVAIFSYFLAINIIYPFAPFQVSDFYPTLSETDLGYYVGYLESSFFLGTILASVIWARLADRFGRRPIVIIGLSGTLISAVTYGFSVNYAMALITRFIWGLLDANLGIVKTILGEIATPGTQAKLYSLFGVMGGIGRLSGNLVGGLLSNLKTSDNDKDVFIMFPYELPCLVSGVVSLMSLVFVCLFLKETNKFQAREHTRRKTRMKATQALQEAPQVEMLEIEHKASLVRDGTSDNTNGSASADSVISTSASSTSVVESENSVEIGEEPHERRTTWQVMKIHNVWVLSLFYCILGGLGAGYNAVFALWALNPKEDFGFGWTSSQIGAVFAVVGPVYMLSQIFLYRRYVAKFGYVKGAKLGMFLFGLAAMALPHLSSLRYIEHTGLSVVVTTFVSLTFIPRVFAFTNTFAMINNAGDNSIRATANGLTQMFGSVGRIAAPTALCNLFAWSCGNGLGWPFNYVLSFYIMGLLAWLGALILHFLLPKDFEDVIQTHKRGNKVTTNAASETSNTSNAHAADTADASNDMNTDAQDDTKASLMSGNGGNDEAMHGKHGKNKNVVRLSKLRRRELNYGIRAMDSQFGLITAKTPDASTSDLLAHDKDLDMTVNAAPAETDVTEVNDVTKVNDGQKRKGANAFVAALKSKGKAKKNDGELTYEMLGQD